MKTSESFTKVAAALAKAQASIHHAGKDSQNPHLKNKYASLTSVIDACKDVLAKHDIAVIQSPALVEGQHVLETYLMHSSGEYVMGIVPLLIGKNDMQGLGSAITYARRYGLSALLNISQEDDDGQSAGKVESKSAQAKSAPKPAPLKNHAPGASIDSILKGFSALGISKAEIEERYGVPASRITDDQILELKEIGGLIKNKKATKDEYFNQQQGA